MFITIERSTTTTSLLGIIACFCTPAFGDFIQYGQADREAWFEDLPNARAITFQEHPFEYPTVLLDTEFYEESHGVVFSTSSPAGPLQVTQSSNWQLDGHGLTLGASPAGSLILNFTEPMIAFAGAFNGYNTGYEVYSKGLLIESGNWSLGPGFANNFRGFVSDTPFDQVRLTGHGLSLLVDDFYFAAIPSPAGVAVLVLAGAVGGRRRRL